MIKAGIVGATGYAGAELVRILSRHGQADIKWLYSKSYKDTSYASIFQNVREIIDKELTAGDLKELSKDTDVIFTATPQGYLGSVLDEDILKNSVVIDLSADFRIRDVSVYEKWYGIEHKSPQFIKEAVYGLCEKNRDKVKNARLIANPGCYPTCSFLSVSPAIKGGFIDPCTVIIDAKSGTSGAGRGAKTDNLFCEVNENIKAYGLPSHRHTPEIEQELSEAAGYDILVNFSPHLVPMNRGILVTAYASLTQNKDGSYPKEDEIRAYYEALYENEKFVRFLPKGVFPQTRWVEGSNYTDVNIAYDERTKRLIMMGALDNIVKGAAGQAVQNMNIVFCFEETGGIDMVPLFP